jgi:hypothetical protein
MASILKVDTIQDQDGNNIINENANTITIGASGDTITIPSGATLANSGIITGFESTGIDDNATSTAITIDSSGNVGIGTSSPTPPTAYGGLHINSQYPVLKLSSTTSGTGVADGFTVRINSADDAQLWHYENKNMSFATNNTERMRIDSSGKVSIGDTTSSGYRLKIKGTLANDADDQGILLEEAGTGGAFIKYDGAANLLKLGGYNAGEVDSINIVRNTGDVGIGTTTPDAKLSVNGVASFGDGTALLPSIANFGDLNTGMWFPAADTIAFSEGGVEAMRIDSSGNVGIGTSSPGRTLHVKSGASTTIRVDGGTDGSHAAFFESAIGGTVHYQFGVTDNSNNFSIYDSQNAATRFLINSSGNVGIGTTSPNSYAGQTALTINSSGVARVDLDVSDTIVGTLTGESTYVGLFSQGASTTLRLGTNNTERMRIDSSGNVGIGTSSPTARLSVADSKTGTEASPHLVILGNGYTGNHWLDTSAYYIGQNSNARLLRIYSGSNEAVGVELGVGATSFGTYSDERLKKDITDLTNGLNKILALRPVNFKYKSDADDYRNRIGIIAQSIVGQVDEALDETKITADDETQYYNVRYQDLIPVLVKGIQEQQTQIQELV